MKRLNNIIMFACALVLMACSGSDEVSEPTPTPSPTQPTEDVAVSFSTGVSTASSRVTTGLITNDDALQNLPEGFGVFAYPTEGQTFAEKYPGGSGKPSTAASAYTAVKDFFMQNQQVKYSNVLPVREDDGSIKVDENGDEVWTKDWVYSPLKYWPNYSDNALGNRRNISFFAYAPYVAAAGAEYGVVNFTRDADRSPHVIYKMGEPSQQVDILWASCMNATRNGNGLIEVVTSGDPAVTTLEFQKVPLEFRHALSAIDIYVQRVYDEPAFDGKVPDPTGEHTKLYVSKLQLTSPKPASGKNAFQKSGKLSLIDGSWSDDGTWVGSDEGDQPVTIEYGEQLFEDKLRGTISTAEDVISDYELDKWGIGSTYNTTTEKYDWDATTMTGVNENEQFLLKEGLTQMVLPAVGGSVMLIPTLTYSMVTRDDDLQNNYLTDSEGHRYSRIVNEVQANSVTLDLAAGKRYSLLLRISAEHVSFEVVSVVDWDFPMRYDPSVVTDFTEEMINHVLDEGAGS